MYKEIGRVNEDMEGLDLGGENEDMTGVYSTGLSELVGQVAKAKAKAKGQARLRQGRAVKMRSPTGKLVVVRRTAGGTSVSPMPSRPVQGVVPRRSGISRVNIDQPLIITAGKVSPAMNKLDPSTAQLLRIIENGTQGLRGDGIAVYRQRSNWPGERGYRPY